MMPVVHSSRLMMEADEHVAPCMRQSRQAVHLERFRLTIDWVNYLSRVALSYSVLFACDISSTQETCGSDKAGRHWTCSFRGLPWSDSPGMEPHVSICTDLAHYRQRPSVDIKRQRSVDSFLYLIIVTR